MKIQIYNTILRFNHDGDEVRIGIEVEIDIMVEIRFGVEIWIGDGVTIGVGFVSANENTDGFGTTISGQISGRNFKLERVPIRFNSI